MLMRSRSVGQLGVFTQEAALPDSVLLHVDVKHQLWFSVYDLPAFLGCSPGLLRLCHVELVAGFTCEVNRAAMFSNRPHLHVRKQASHPLGNGSTRK